MHTFFMLCIRMSILVKIFQLCFFQLQFLTQQNRHSVWTQVNIYIDLHASYIVTPIIRNIHHSALSIDTLKNFITVLLTCDRSILEFAIYVLLVSLFLYVCLIFFKSVVLYVQDEFLHNFDCLVLTNAYLTYCVCFCDLFNSINIAEQ